MAIATLLPATLRNVLSALWCAQRRTWKATYFSLCPAAWQKSAWSYKKMHPDSLYHTVTLCGQWHDLSSLSTSMSCLISPLLPEFTHSFSQRLGCPKCCPMRLHFLAFFFLGPPSISVLLPHLQPSKPPTGRQLWIIKWWIRAYFLPTQTGDCWASSLAIGLIPLTTRNSTKSHRCLSSFGRKTVDSPAHPHVSSTPGSTRLGSSRLKFLQ